MIPTLLLLGLVVGAFVHERRSATVVAAAAMSWGIMVGVAAGELSTVFGGAALGFGNLVAGAGIAGSIRSIFRWASQQRRRPRTDDVPSP